MVGTGSKHWQPILVDALLTLLIIYSYYFNCTTCFNSSQELSHHILLKAPTIDVVLYLVSNLFWSLTQYYKLIFEIVCILTKLTSSPLRKYSTYILAHNLMASSCWDNDKILCNGARSSSAVSGGRNPFLPATSTSLLKKKH